MHYIKANKNKDIILQLQAWYRFQVFPHTSRSSKEFRKRLAVSRISLLIALSSALFWEITEARLKMESQISSSCTAKWATCGFCLQDCTQSNRDPKNKDLGESKTWTVTNKDAETSLHNSSGKPSYSTAAVTQAIHNLHCMCCSCQGNMMVNHIIIQVIAM